MPKGVYPRERRYRGRPAAERLAEMVEPDGECLIWRTPVRARYPWIWVDGSYQRAHRVAYELANGPIPDGMNVLHRCDRSRCVRVEHLFLGSQADNVADMVKKGRNRHPTGDDHWTHRRPDRRPEGVRNPYHRLTEDDVRTIRRLRAEGLMFKDIAARIGVSTPCVQHVVDGRTWRHVA